MIRLSEVGELEVDGESLGDAVGVIDGEAADDFAGLRHQPSLEFFGGGSDRRLIAMLDQEPAQALDYLEEGFAFLLDKDTAQQYAERTDVAPQGKLLGGGAGVGRGCGQTGGLGPLAAAQ